MYTKQRLLVSMASLCYEMTFVTIQKNKVTTIERPSALTCCLLVFFFFVFFFWWGGGVLYLSGKADLDF